MGSLREFPRRAAALVASFAIGGSTLVGAVTVGWAQDDGTGAAPLPPPTNCVLVAAQIDSSTPEVEASASQAATPDATPAAGSASPVVSPEASPDATPVTGIASPVASPEASPDATPVAGSASPVASPVASLDATRVMDRATPVASPVAGEIPSIGSAPEEHVIKELTATVDAIFACLNERNFEGYAAYTSDTFRGLMFGSDQPLPADQFVQLAATLPEIPNRVESLENFRWVGPDVVSLDITFVTANQLNRATWTFTRGRVDGLLSWILDHEELLPVVNPVGASRIDVTFGDTAIVLAPSAVDGADVVLNLTNPAKEDHEALVLKLDAGVDTSVLLQGGAAFPEGVAFVGQATVIAGTNGNLVLVGLEPGTYTIVDLLPDANGAPHLSLGMEATFAIASPRP